MKKVLYVLLAIVALYFVLALFGPKQVKVERQITVNKPVDEVRSRLTDFHYFHDEWSPWSEYDPNMKYAFSGEPGKAGHQYTWSGNKDVGSGAMELSGFNGDSVLQKLSFTGQGDAKSYYVISSRGDNATEITWGLLMDIGFFGRTPMLFMNMDKMVGKDFERGLSKLKGKLEGSRSDVAAKDYQINEQQWPERVFISSPRAHLKAAELGKFFGENFPKLYGDMEKHNLRSPMHPAAIYYTWNDSTMETDCAAAMAAPDGAKVPDMKPWEKCTVPASKVLHIAYYGDYNKSADAHMAMDRYMRKNGQEQEMVIEEYVTDPGAEKDTTKWLTNIYYVLRGKKA